MYLYGVLFRFYRYKRNFVTTVGMTRFLPLQQRYNSVTVTICNGTYVLPS